MKFGWKPLECETSGEMGPLERWGASFTSLGGSRVRLALMCPSLLYLINAAVFKARFLVLWEVKSGFFAMSPGVPFCWEQH